jgi:hypothetical protein
MPHNPFHATVLVLGIGEAKIQASKHEFMLPPCFVHEVTSMSHIDHSEPPKKCSCTNQCQYIDIDAGFGGSEEDN